MLKQAPLKTYSIDKKVMRTFSGVAALRKLLRLLACSANYDNSPTPPHYLFFWISATPVA